jgi:hypothetical protein
MILGLASSAMKRREFITLLGGAAARWPADGISSKRNVPNGTGDARVTRFPF